MGTEVLLNQIRDYDEEFIVSSMRIVLDYDQINMISTYMQSNSGIDTLDHTRDTNMVSIDNNVEIQTVKKRTYKSKNKGWQRGKKNQRTEAQKQERRAKDALKKTQETEQKLRQKGEELKGVIASLKEKVEELEYEIIDTRDCDVADTDSTCNYYPPPGQLLIDSLESNKIYEGQEIKRDCM